MLPKPEKFNLKCAGSWGSLRRSPDPLIVSGFVPKALASRPLPRLEADPPSSFWANLTLEVTRDTTKKAPPYQNGLNKGPSIYDVHTERGGVRLRWTHADGEGGSAPCGRLHRNL